MVQITGTRVKELVREWLERDFEFVRNEFLVEGRRIDFSLPAGPTKAVSSKLLASNARGRSRRRHSP